MGNFNFDEIIERRGTNALKYDFAVERNKPKDILPLWVADMDFKTAPCITKRLQEDIDKGIFGYTETGDAYFFAVQKWMRDSYSYDVSKDWMIKTPGVVFALAMTVKAFTKPNDAVLIQNPVYYPFAEVIQDNGRILIDNTLVYKNGAYEIDFADMEDKIVENQVKLFLLCSPHNPVGRVWKEWELQKIGEICLKHHVIVVSDEIHADFVYKGHSHHVFSTISDAFRDISVICTAPSKTFNIAGFQIANIFIENKELRNQFLSEKTKAGFSQVSMSGISACQAAYEDGREWYEELKEYLAENLIFTRTYLKEHLPKIKLVEPEGTYLLWLDFRAYGYDVKTLNHKVIYEANLWLDSGEIFGPCGEGFQRLNMACPRKTLQKALVQLRETFEE